MEMYISPRTLAKRVFLNFLKGILVLMGCEL